MLSKRYESTEVDRELGCMCPRVGNDNDITDEVNSNMAFGVGTGRIQVLN